MQSKDEKLYFLKKAENQAQYSYNPSGTLSVPRLTEGVAYFKVPSIPKNLEKKP